MRTMRLLNQSLAVMGRNKMRAFLVMAGVIVGRQSEVEPVAEEVRALMRERHRIGRPTWTTSGWLPPRPYRTWHRAPRAR